MAGEVDAEIGRPGEREHAQHPFEHGRALLHLPQDADLHVVDDERGRRGIHGFAQTLRDGEAISLLHGFASLP